ncbi:MAG: prepilin-type N-terminal cleavage/methylation domain-containing protein [Candidatus Paceibacterota bacterium]|jgi:prepilin-type N-terminal cleavage/methylation domain-containing protein
MQSLSGRHGFSLPELIVSVTVIALLAILSIEAFFSFSKTQALDASVSSIVLALRDARARTLAGVAGNQHGVKVESNRYTVFRGSSFAADVASNEVFMMSSFVFASSSTDSFVFERVTGNSLASGTIDVYLASDPATRKTISVQGTGLVDIQ